MKDGELYALVLGAAVLLGYVFAKAGVAYVSHGTPMPAQVGVDPSLAWIDPPNAAPAGAN